MRSVAMIHALAEVARSRNAASTARERRHVAYVARRLSVAESLIHCREGVARLIAPYRVEDVTLAVYCVNSWTRTRSALTSALTLNEALSSVERFGDQRIRHYSELRAFFQAVAVYLPTTDRDDLLLGDFGEVQIAFDGEILVFWARLQYVYPVSSCVGWDPDEHTTYRSC